MINTEYEILSFGEFGNLFKRIKVNSKNNTYSNEPIEFNKGHFIAITGCPGGGKSYFINQLRQQLESQGISSICFGTDDGTPTIQDKNNLLEVSRNNFNVVIYDSTGDGQKYPEDTIMINFNPMGIISKRKQDNFDWVSLLLTSLTNIRKIDHQR